MKHAAILTALLILCLFVLPASAMILEVTVKGTVSSLDKENFTLTIADPARYGCNYGAGSDTVCSYTPMTGGPLTGSVPVESAFSVFSAGDSVVATSLGGPGGKWITLAKLAGPGAGQETVTDMVGDPATIRTPLAGDYSLDLATEPDCTACQGTTCTAATSLVKVLSGKEQVMVQEIEPGHALTYNGRNDGSAVTVTFVRGQASSLGCAGRDSMMMTGSQAISVYIVHVVPPIGSGTPAVQAAGTSVTTPAEARPSPTRSGPLPVAAIGALAAVALLGAARRS
jgi:hypothetical protein